MQEEECIKLAVKIPYDRDDVVMESLQAYDTADGSETHIGTIGASEVVK